MTHTLSMLSSIKAKRLHNYCHFHKPVFSNLGLVNQCLSHIPLLLQEAKTIFFCNFVKYWKDGCHGMSTALLVYWLPMAWSWCIHFPITGVFISYDCVCFDRTLVHNVLTQSRTSYGRIHPCTSCPHDKGRSTM